MHDSAAIPLQLQTAVVVLAHKAKAGSEMRRLLCEAASVYPAVGTDPYRVDFCGGLSREDVAGLLRRINEAREVGDDPHRSLRSMRNALERALDLFDLPGGAAV